MRAHLIVDLGFGDAGKGLLTDFLARQTHAGLVVRYNGGAQAGHNVVTPDGRHHTFAQFGSGAFLPGVRTFLARQVVVHPTALLAEGDLLQAQGVADVYARLRLSEQALVITPFHQAANRLRELARGAGRHGSCGVGVGEAVEDARAHPQDGLLAGDLARPASLRRTLGRIRERLRAQLAAMLTEIPPDSQVEREWSVFERDDLAEAWIASLARFNELELVAPDETLKDWMNETDTVIFEGAQGVLLDALAGFHPYTTWSRCTTQNAIELISEMAPAAEVTRLGVLRCYAVRHGPGPLPTESADLQPHIREHNQAGAWQGAVRYGWFDAVLARYALEVNGGVDALALTHLDLPPRLGTWKYCPAYREFDRLRSTPAACELSGGLLTAFHLPAALPLEARQQVTGALLAVRPVLEECSKDERLVIEKVEALLGQPLNILARGPRAADVQVIKPLLHAILEKT